MSEETKRIALEFFEWVVDSYDIDNIFYDDDQLFDIFKAEKGYK